MQRTPYRRLISPTLPSSHYVTKGYGRVSGINTPYLTIDLVSQQSSNKSKLIKTKPYPLRQNQLDILLTFTKASGVSLIIRITIIQAEHISQDAYQAGRRNARSKQVSYMRTSQPVFGLEWLLTFHSKQTGADIPAASRVDGNGFGDASNRCRCSCSILCRPSHISGENSGPGRNAKYESTPNPKPPVSQDSSWALCFTASNILIHRQRHAD